MRRRAFLLAAFLACRREAPAPPLPPRSALPTPTVPTLPSAAATAPSVLAVVEAQGTVWRTDAAGKKGDAADLAAGDSLSSGTNSRAVLRLRDGRELVLEPQTRLRIKSASDGRLEVELQEGQILSRSGAPASGPALELTVLTPLGITRVPAEAGQAKIALGGSGVQIDVGVGQVAFLDRTGREVTASANERIEVSVGGVQLMRAPAQHRAAEVVLPTQRGLRIYADDLSRVTLSWPPELTDADVEVSRDATFKRLLPFERGGLGQATVSAPRRGDLYWRVRSGASALVGQARFSPAPRRSLLDLRHPENVVDDRGQVTTVYFQGVRPAITFAFTPTPDADRYRLRVYRPGALEVPLLEREVRDTRCSIEADALDEGNYLWHAQALDRSGQQLGGGRMNKLTLAYDNSVTSLAIATPRLQGKEVEVSGVAPLGSRLYVNGAPVTVDDKGRFSTRATRARALVFRLVGKNGAESYWVRNMRPRS